MKNKYFLIIFALISIIGISCDDKWDSHYSQNDLITDSDIAEFVDGSVENYVKSNSDLSTLSGLFEQADIYSKMAAKDQLFTVLAYSNASMSGINIDDPVFFANSCICDLNFGPTKLQNGLAMLMWNEKYLEVTQQTVDGQIETYIGGSKVEKVISTNNGFIYLLETPVISLKSIYQYLEELGENYSAFKNLVYSFEEKVLDKENSKQIGVDPTGNTIYDSVFIIKNTLMDRYNSSGTETWSMRSEYYSSTMLIPSNDLVESVLRDAYDAVPAALGREPNASDSIKFREWIVKACFYNKILTPADLDGETDITSVSGYQEGASANTAGIQWKPTVQKVNTASKVELSNGVAYYISAFKIPNNVVIHRIKNRFYIWENCTAEEKAEYFKWTNLDTSANAVSVRTADGGMGPIGIWPYISYNTLQVNAFDIQENLVLEMTGIQLKNDEISVAKIPPGKYNLYMGFREAKKPGYGWRLNVYHENNSLPLKSNIDVSGWHLDRSNTGYPENFVPADWTSYDSKAANYDRHGRLVGEIELTGEGLQPLNLKLEITGIANSDEARRTIYLYHWCLVPTSDNY